MSNEHEVGEMVPAIPAWIKEIIITASQTGKAADHASSEIRAYANLCAPPNLRAPLGVAPLYGGTLRAYDVAATYRFGD